MPVIVEGLVTTCNLDGTAHLAPMGPIVEADPRYLLFRPFPTSHTGANLLRDRQGVFHITDDACLIARAAVGRVEVVPDHVPAHDITGHVLRDACRAQEFRIIEVDESGERIRMRAEIVRTHRLRDFFGFHRSKHALLEAAILATRFDFLDPQEIRAEFRKLRIIVDKTGTAEEADTLMLLESLLDAHLAKGGDR